MSAIHNQKMQILRSIPKVLHRPLAGRRLVWEALPQVTKGYTDPPAPNAVPPGNEAS